MTMLSVRIPWDLISARAKMDFVEMAKTVPVIRVSKVIYVCFGFALLRLLTGLKNSRHFLDQSEVKPKPITSTENQNQS